MNTNRSARISVLLVDDHAVVREGYRRLLEAHGSVVVVGEAASALEAEAKFSALAPDVVVMDIALPGVSGIEAMRRMLSADPGVRVLMFSMYEDTIYADRALQAGARGYVTKASAPHVLMAAVEAVANGGKYLSPDIAQELALRNVATASVAPEGLTVRELEVLRLLVQGLSVRNVADTLRLTPKTVANHKSTIKPMLGAETSVQVARIGAALLKLTMDAD